MSSLAAWIQSFVGNFFAAFVVREAAVFIRRISVIASILAFIAGLASVFFAAVQTLMNGIAYALGDSLLLEIIFMCWPPHVSVCLAVILSAHLLRWVYDSSSEVALLILRAWS